MRSYIEFPPTYCEGDLYVNTFEGATYAIEAETGKVQWRRRVGGTLPSSPAIDGPRVIVASQSGTVTALDRDKGRVLWKVTTGGKVESSPVVVDGLVYFGSHDGRLFAVASKTGNIRWAYSTGGRINASPSVFGGRVCAGNYSGAIFCLDKDTGREIWTTYLRRDAFRRESFYASTSTDGERLYSVARSGSVVALDVESGDVSWTGQVGGLGYTTPAVADGRVFVGGFDGRLRALRARNGVGAVVEVGRRSHPRRAGGHRQARLLLDAREEDVRASRVRRRDRLAAAAGPLLARASRPSGRTSSRSTAG